MEKIDELIALSEKKTALLKEYRESSKYESCRYDVRPLPGRPAFFMLFEIATRRLVYEGVAAKVYNWLERRKVPYTTVYNANSIEYDFGMPADTNDWWGYLHSKGSLQVKRYFGALDTDEARESPFTKEVVGPFKAASREEALQILAARLRELGYLKTWDV